MFRRLILEDYAAVCTAGAFLVAVTIFVMVAWRALRMPRAQSDHLANLPFTSDSATTRHDERA
jgi:hypothetical protein